MVKGYCLKEKRKNVEIQNPKYELDVKGRAMVRGTCPHCGAGMCKRLSNAEIPADLKAKMAKKKAGGSRRSRASKKGKSSRRSRRSKK